ncbi:MAG: lysophospholipid acyltransferase family protein [Prevotellaceae bacterium]|jgi:KDO2-lipid IV(A) lauroyltransferase|nr:lysophospholipid acyltransferase family protein [Prevotellaceae bacterium]
MKNFAYACLKGVLFTVSLIPIRAGYVFSSFLYLVLRYIVRYRKKVIEANLRLVFPNMDRNETTSIMNKYYRHMSDLFVEMTYALYISEKSLRKRIRFVNPELLDRYHSEGRHVVAVTGHYANWEWGYGFPIYCRHSLMEVYKKMSSKTFDRLFRDIRARFGGIPVEMSNLKPIVAEARKHPTLIYLIADQTPAGNSQLWYYTSFLGIDGTPVFTGPEKIAHKFNAVFVFVNMQKVKRGHYRIEFIPLCENPENTDTYELTDSYLRTLEKIIYNRPEYWMWSHRRWKRRKMTE